MNEKRAYFSGMYLVRKTKFTAKQQIDLEGMSEQSWPRAGAEPEWSCLGPEYVVR